MRKRYLTAGAVLLCLLGSLMAWGQDPDPVVHVQQGDLRGVMMAGVRVFAGVRYAAPPLGPLRFSPPAPPASWTGVYDATHPGPESIQPSPAWSPGAVAVGDEDCLTLNVTAPLGSGPWPVIVFIHGGAHVTGSASNLHYDGQYLAAHGPAVVVTVEYRLGALGNLALPALTAESPHHASGNQGLQDEIQALSWLHQNVSAFGGDPGHVLIIGQSSGANDVLALMLSPRSSGLYSSAMMMSGGLLIRGTLREAEDKGTRIASALGVSSLTALRALPAADIVLHARATKLVAGGIAYGPNVDGWILPASADTLLKQQQWNRVPLVLGTTADEMADLLPQYGRFPTGIHSLDDYRAAVTDVYGSRRAPAILKQYPLEEYHSAWSAFVALQTDQSFNAPNRRLMRLLAAAPDQPLYRYVYEHIMDAGSRRPLGAAHAFDIPFVFHTMPNGSTEREASLADTFSGYIVQFARTGQPPPAWTAYQAGRDNYLDLDLDPHMQESYRTRWCDFWDSL